MLIDEIQVTFRAGNGGRGKVSFGKMTKSGPDGGNGGDGGDLYVEGVSDLTLLNQFSAKEEWEAENGIAGGKQKMSGHRGNDLTILLPIGTTLKDLATGETWDVEKVGQRLFICKGGRGGKGNWEFRGPQNTTPLEFQPGEPGQVRRLQLSLKFIADIGLVGFPNAGKSSLLKELTNANPKIANYAFTTLTPNLGVLGDKVIADIPGLIEGAHTGRGLGTKFLKHIEKVKLLVHCISSESEDVLKDYTTIRGELESYSPALLEKEEIIVLTKTDLVDTKIVTQKMKILAKTKKTVLPISIYDFPALEKLKEKLKD